MIILALSQLIFYTLINDNLNRRQRRRFRKINQRRCYADPWAGWRRTIWSGPDGI